jgi:hypothetical protein
MNNIYYSNTYLQQIQNLALPNKYTKWYCCIILAALKRSSSKKDAKKILGYVEQHHILPKSFNLGGEKDKLNFAFLSGKEHYVIHRLLSRMFSGEFYYKMNRALWYMLKSGKMHGNNRYIPSASVYQQIKEAHARVQSETKKGKPGHVCSEDTKEYLAAMYKGKTYEELHGIEKAEELRTHLKETGIFTTNNPSIKNIGKTYEEIHGEERGLGMRKAKVGKSNSINSKLGLVKSTISGYWFKSPAGEEVLFCPLRETAKKFNLLYSCLSNVKAGRSTNHKGWTYVRTASENETTDIITSIVEKYQKQLTDI